MSIETRDTEIIGLGREAAKTLLRMDRMLVTNPDYLHGVYMVLSERQGEVVDDKKQSFNQLLDNLNRKILNLSNGIDDGAEFDHLQFQNEINECFGLEDVRLAA